MADAADARRTYAHLRAAGPWRELPGCPGRLVWRGARHVTPAELAGESSDVSTFVVPAARDPVHVVRLPDGGLISYGQADDTWVHTLNTPEGFARKLAQLGIPVP